MKYENKTLNNIREKVDELNFLCDTLINFDKRSLDYSIVKEEFLKKAVLLREEIEKLSDRLRGKLNDKI